MPASYPGAAKTFVSRNAGDVIQPAHINDLQDEVNAIETGLLSGTTVLSTLTVTNAITVTAGQVVFPATQNPSAGANTLDDYEEGTWTPSIGGTATYTDRSGQYTKVGRVVHITGFMQVNVLGTGNTGTITGLPFTAAQTTAGHIGFWGSLAVAPVFVACYASGTSAVFTGITAAANSLSNPIALFGNGATIYFSITYSV